ncbi:uncharacterized protein N7483_007529 [Penicillium malachiteum]|uniref:uncharacterized protein n=1 Tax=Penicillium malachiteum TaxID=1324776 RepID=UPI0025489B0B|nr:uncharacterized protein N7483_007529 [Penicillium malachiteum]KAJ5726172.1 hypothetical protein N7483_007529 [Penicillium malachiteum]
MSSQKPQATYFSNGQALSSPPFSVRLMRFFEGVYVFLGLYIVSLFSLDPYAAAQNSRFNIHRPKSSSGSRNPRDGNSGSSGFGGGGGGGGGGPGGPGRRIGRPLHTDASAWNIETTPSGDVDVTEQRNCGESSMSAVPSNDADWAALISSLKERIPDRSSSQPPIPLNIPQLIDHTLLAEPSEPEQIDQLCAEAIENNFASVCVRPNYVARAAANLKDAPNTAVACVVGFPEGTHDTSVKVREATEAVANGAGELDMVINYPILKDGGYSAVYRDIMAVRKAAPHPIKLKAILETSQLDRDQIIGASIVSCTAGVDFIKTSTGFRGGGADIQDVKVMHFVSTLCFDNGCQVKASGGIRTAGDCLRMIKAGAMRIGTSSGVKIMQEVDEGELLEQGASHAVS